MVSSRTSTFSSVVGSGVGTDDVSHWQSLLATFIVDFASALGHPYFYLLRANTKWILCLLSGLSPIHYSSLLLECQLVRIRKNPADGSRQVMFDRTKWIAFLERYELLGTNGKGGCSEVTDGFIVHAAVFKTTTNVIPVLIRQQRWLYFVLAKYSRENAHPQIRQLTVVMSHHESHMPCER